MEYCGEVFNEAERNFKKTSLQMLNVHRVEVNFWVVRDLCLPVLFLNSTSENCLLDKANKQGRGFTPINIKSRFFFFFTWDLLGTLSVAIYAYNFIFLFLAFSTL